MKRELSMEMQSKLTYALILFASVSTSAVTHANDCVDARKYTVNILSKLEAAASTQGFAKDDISKVKLDFRCHWNPEQSLNAEAEGHTIHFANPWLARLETEDEVAMILGHELSHIILRHIINVDAPISTKGVRKKESAADTQALLLMSAAGYNANEGISAIEYLREINRESTENFNFLKRYYFAVMGIFPTDHPTIKSRVKNLQETIEYNDLNCEIEIKPIDIDVKAAAERLQRADENNPMYNQN